MIPHPRDVEAILLQAKQAAQQPALSATCVGHAFVIDVYSLICYIVLHVEFAFQAHAVRRRRPDILVWSELLLDANTT